MGPFGVLDGYKSTAWGDFHQGLRTFAPDRGNWGRTLHVQAGVKSRKWVISLLFGAAAIGAAADAYSSAQQKIDAIESDRLRTGSRVTLTYPELNAWVARKAPDGVHGAKVVVTEHGVATGTASVDFLKVQRAQGQNPGWLLSKLLDGERPVSVTARIRSSGGTATVDVERVEISGVAVDGRPLEFLIQNILLPLYPDAVVGKPFELGHRIERLDVAPTGVGITIGK